MGLNTQKGNMYGFVNFTWNTVKGKCPHDCSYCYMKRFPQNDVRFDNKELKTDLGSGNFIFVGSSCDMFANDIPDEWIEKTLSHCRKHQNNKYLFQSKNPSRMTEFDKFFPDNTMFCTTIETNRNILLDKYSGGGSYENRLSNVFEMENLMITIEPIMDFDQVFIKDLKWTCAKQINIGADSGNNGLPEPSKEKILAFIEQLEKFTVVFQKPNLKRLLK